MAVANSRLKAGQSDESAARTAWFAVKQGWRKDPKSGQWKRIQKSFRLFNEAMSGEAPFIKAQVSEVEPRLGIVFGWGIVTKIRQEDGTFAEYTDLQDDHIPDSSMLRAAVAFMDGSRTHKVMHDGDAVGKVLFCFPLTEDIAKAYGISAPQYGLMIAVKPNNDDVLRAFEEGRYTGFSIGGERLRDEVEALA